MISTASFDAVTNEKANGNDDQTRLGMTKASRRRLMDFVVIVKQNTFSVLAF